MRLLLSALLATLAVAATAGAATQRPLVVKVDHVRAYLDVSGPGKGELLVRVFSRYGRSSVKGKWWGVTEATIRGPGGIVSLADIRRLHHPERGERVDHRLLMRPEVARHLLGHAGAHATLRILGSAYLIPVRAPGSATRAACCQYAAKIHPVANFPGEQRTFGNGNVWVDWTESTPWQAYVSKVVVPRAGDEIDGADATVQPDGTFSGTGTDTCGDAAAFNGSVTPPNADGTFPDDATVTVGWNIPYNDLGGCGSSGSTTYSIDP
jgi:hypothetical protein